jgi:Protein of unknown function (DUF3276)
MMQTQSIENLAEKLERYYPKRPAPQPFMMRQPDRRKSTMIEPVASKAVKAGSRTYFFDVKTTSQGTQYLTITELRKGVRSSIMIFPDDAPTFLEPLKEMISKLT